MRNIVISRLMLPLWKCKLSTGIRQFVPDASVHELQVTVPNFAIISFLTAVNPALFDAGFIVFYEFHLFLAVQTLHRNFPL